MEVSQPIFLFCCCSCLIFVGLDICNPILLLLFLNLFLQSTHYPPPGLPSNCSSAHTPSPRSISKMSPPRPPPHQTSPLPGASNLLRVRYIFSHWGNTLLYMCREPQISWCMLPSWWLSVWEISRVQVNLDCWSSYRVALFLSFFQLFPNSTYF